jgi:hypothetical protein
MIVPIVSCPICRLSFHHDALPSRLLAVGDPCPWWRDGTECRQPLVPERGNFARIVKVVMELRFV